MNRNEITEKIAAAIRRCKVAPDYLIYIDNQEFASGEFDEIGICGIPVLTVANNVYYHPYGDSDLVFIPCWKDERNRKMHINFERGYEEA
jgi:hypothetical protein